MPDGYMGGRGTNKAKTAGRMGSGGDPVAVLKGGQAFAFGCLQGRHMEKRLSFMGKPFFSGSLFFRFRFIVIARREHGDEK